MWQMPIVICPQINKNRLENLFAEYIDMVEEIKFITPIASVPILGLSLPPEASLKILLV
jgi:hypothetical protein